MIERLPLRRGGEVRIHGAGVEFVTLESTSASPPGSSLELELAGAPITVKVRSCRKTAAGNFVIEGRWVGMSRPQREALLGVSTTPSDSPPKIPE